MKLSHIIAAGALVVSAFMAVQDAAAASPYDGAYACTVYVPALQTSASGYAVFLAHADGTAAISVLAPVPMNVYGFGFGTLSGSTFSGTSGNSGTPFTVNFTSSGMSSSNFQWQTAVGLFPATTNCIKIF